MADEGKTPVAVRITRPYGSEEEFLARELETLTRTSIVLLGAQQRPQGVILRFELVLATGAPLVRGEGRVVGYKERAFDELPGLTLRFTRLDSRSKALIDRAAAMRDARSRPPPAVAPSPPRPPTAPPPRPPTAPPPRPPTAPPPRPQASPQRPPTAPPPRPAPPAKPEVKLAPLELDLESTRAEVPEAKRASERPPAPASASRPPVPPRASAPPAAVAPTPPRIAPPPPPAPVDLEATHAEAPQPKRSSERPAVPAAASGQHDARTSSPDRDAALARLRERRKSLDEDAVNALLSKKPL